MTRAKDLIQKIEKDIEKAKSREIEIEIEKEHKQKIFESNKYEFHLRASEILSQKFKYIIKDLKDFELEMQKICKDVNVIYKDETSFLNNESVYSGYLDIGRVVYSLDTQIECSWLLSLDVPGLYNNNDYKKKLSNEKFLELVQPKNFYIYHSTMDVTAGPFEGHHNDEYNIPMDRYDLFLEKYIALITRHVKENLGNIKISYLIKKKKKFFFF